MQAISFRFCQNVIALALDALIHSVGGYLYFAVVYAVLAILANEQISEIYGVSVLDAARTVESRLSPVGGEILAVLALITWNWLANPRIV